MTHLLKRFSFKRKITSYDKVQKIISPLVRSCKVFINFSKIKHLQYLNVGCSSNIHSGFIHLDYSWHDRIDICWDINKLPYPLKSNTLKGIYTEHCLEHIPFGSFQKNIAEFFRLLAPGGTLRLIMPDGEKYIDWYKDIKNGIPRESLYGQLRPTPMMNINDVFRNYGHQFIYDFETVVLILKETGFTEIQKMAYQQGRDPILLLDLERRANESLYVEAIKPY